MRKKALVLTCEHATNALPPEYQYLFLGGNDILNTHRGWDPGALLLIRLISESLGVECHIYQWSRLLIEVNRSEDHPQLFSEFIIDLKSENKQVLLNEFYRPYRKRIEAAVEQLIDKGQQVVHVSIHTFTPVWEGKERQVDVGLLFDDQRVLESWFCMEWASELQRQLPNQRICLNEPYRGADDGFTTFLRHQFRAKDYLGLEIEVNQRYAVSELTSIGLRLGDSLKSLLQ